MQESCKRTACVTQTGLGRRQARSVHARCSMVAIETFGSAMFDEEEAGTSTPHGNTTEELDDIEEELQVRWVPRL